jgi:hypothetical protein
VDDGSVTIYSLHGEIINEFGVLAAINKVRVPYHAIP